MEKNHCRKTGYFMLAHPSNKFAILGHNIKIYYRFNDLLKDVTISVRVSVFSRAKSGRLVY